jgi:multidrug efflux pump subunit AcrA (membrane-fusion protein)
MSSKKKVILLVVIAVIGVLVRQIVFGLRKQKVTYETSPAEKGTLITSISGSGTITSGNYTNVTTKVSGVVKKVYVTNGNAVQKGEKIAEVTLDDYAQERQAAAWVAYLEAKEDALEAINDKAEADIAVWEAREAVIEAQEDVDNDEGDTEGEKMIVTKTLDQTRKAFSVAESKYLNADADMFNANAKVAAALRDYQENSATIIAPASGTITDLALAEGIIVSASSTTSSTSGATIVSAQTVGKINDPEGQLIATANLTEIDIINVKADQKVTLTLDAYPDNTFTGKVLAVNTSGSVSSGVTSYPVTILLDPVSVEIYPNMAVSMEIITSIKTDVILVPTTAIQIVNDQSVVQIMKDGQVTTVEVEIGNSNDLQTEVVSGVSEGDEVVTSIITSEDYSQTGEGTTSPFSGIGRPGSSRIEIRQGPPGGF